MSSIQQVMMSQNIAAGGGGVIPVYNSDVKTNTTVAAASTLTTSAALTPSGSNTILIALVAHFGGTGSPTISGCKYGATGTETAMTQIPGFSALMSTSFDARVIGFYKLSPAATSTLVQATWSTSSTEDKGIMAFTVTGVHQTTPFGTAVTATGVPATSPSISVNAATNELVIDLVCTGKTTLAVGGTGHTSVSELELINSESSIGCAKTAGTGGSNAISWTISGSGDFGNYWAQAGIALKPN